VPLIDKPLDEQVRARYEGDRPEFLERIFGLATAIRYVALYKQGTLTSRAHLAGASRVGV